MLAGMDLNQIFLFPVKDAEARKHFLIGCLVVLASFVIPIVPYLALFGYSARIAKQIFNSEEPRMIPWDDWGDMIKDGLRMFGVRMIYSIPMLLIAIPLMFMGLGLPILLENVSSSDAEAIFSIFMVLMLGSMCLIIPLSLPLAVIIPAAEMHAVEKDDFAAGFKFREWWQIFRANLSGFIASFAIYYGATMILTVFMQIIIATLILACLLPLILPGITLYLSLVMYAAIAQAYKIGKEKVTQTETQSALTA